LSTAAVADPSAGSARGRAAVILSAALGASLNPLNSTMIAVALPALSAEFGAAASAVTLTVVTGYLVATLVSQVPAGNIADRAGYGRALSWGRWLFLAGSLAGTFAPALWAVIAGRLMMAAGGSLILPTAMALVRVAIPAERRQRAFGAMGAVLGGAAAIGPAIGAWMTAHAGWRSLFLINLPILALSYLCQPADSAFQQPAVSGPRAAFDWAGSVMIGIALVLFTFATRAGASAGVPIAAAGAVVLGLLLWHEQRTPDPVLKLDLFVTRGFITAAGVIALQNLAMYSLLIQVPFLFGGSSAAAQSRLGVAIIAMTATMAITAPAGGWFAEWLGARPVVALGGLVGAAGVLAIGRLPPGAPAVDVGLRLLLVGVGLGLSTGPSQAVALTSAPASRSAVASATMSMLRYLGAIAGTVILGYAFAGPDSAARQHTALLLFAAAFVVSMGLGLAFPSMPALRRAARA